MNDADARAMKDQHYRDEAELRREQQRAAGTTHSPVEGQPQHGAQPEPGGWRAGSYVADYETALATEAAAWSRVSSTPQGSADFAAAWQEWRAAVEERDRATRLLINQSL